MLARLAAEGRVLAITGLWLEAYRLWLLGALERELRRCGYDGVAGVDEAGRGALAGPVVVAAVVVDRDTSLVPGVDDSKLLSPGTREALAPLIRGTVRDWKVVSVSAWEIDRSHILAATRSAMRGALLDLSAPPDCALVDAVDLGEMPFPVCPLVRGDRVSYAVAAASILAKTERDRMMVELHRAYPQYGFAGHKGYGAPAHLQALQTYGPSPEHRLTYRAVVPRTGAGGS